MNSWLIFHLAVRFHDYSLDDIQRKSVSGQLGLFFFFFSFFSLLEVWGTVFSIQLFPQKIELYVMAVINYSFRSSEMNGGPAYDLK